jgi:hypothetical protein
MKKGMLVFAPLLFFAFFSFLSMVAAPAPAIADGGPSSATIQFKLENPLKGSTTINGFLEKVLDAVVLLLTPVIVVMLLWTGFLFVKAQGNGEALESAKKSLLWTLVGAAIVLGAKGLAVAIGSTISQF